MISQLISYLIDLPTPTSSPMALALNGSSALLAELGGTSGPVVGVNLVSTRDQSGDPPYCRFYDPGDRPVEASFLGRPRGIAEIGFLMVECAAYGPTDSIASTRAEYLMMAVEGQIQTLINSYFAALSPMVDLVGSNSYNKISMVNIVGGVKRDVIKGPGSDVTNQFTATCTVKVQVRLFKSRAAA